ncbi:cytochrome P450 [Streptosporangium sp. NPDC020145]|uniref:cytochrome P450 n=1 Tax=Streptosporangium sp. NPDC020145 TaxID=3154694 RepID=UPI003441BE5D
MSRRSPTWTAGGAGLDIADPLLYVGDRHLDVWREARRTHPIAWCESERAGGFWSVTTHRLGGQVVKHPGRFGSALGMRLGGNEAAVKAASGRMLVVSDGTEHRALRAAHSTWFNGRAVAALQPGLERMIDDLVRTLLERGEAFDAVRDLAVAIPTWLLFEMMGVPPDDRDELARFIAVAFDDTDPGPAAASARTAAHAGVFAYFADRLEEGRNAPGDDMVTSLAQAAVNGRPLSDEEVILNCDGLMNGGLETTPHAMSGALLAFIEHPGAWRRLKEDPGLIDSAVEEILRWTSPAMHAMRTAMTDSTLGAARIREGDRVVVWFPSCNRDEEVFPEAGRFLIDRRPNPHMSFGGGPHYCVGAALARIELRCLLRVLLRRVAAVEPAGEAVRQRSNFLNGLERLEVTMVPELHGEEI